MDLSCQDNIEKLYKCYEILSNSGKLISEHEFEYKQILEAVKGSPKEKRLASQFIGKFFSQFPNLTETAIDAQLDLCEDEDIQIRKQAIKDLPQLCKNDKTHVPKISDILTQLLVVEDSTELQQVNNSLQLLTKYDVRGTLTGIFSQIQTGDEITRERAFTFLSSKIMTMGKEIITNEMEDFVITEVKNILHDVTADEFQTCMTVLSATKLGTTLSGHSELVKLTAEQADLDGNVELTSIDDEVIERFIQCATHALPYFSTKVESTTFITFMCKKFLQTSTWTTIGATDNQEQMQLRLLKVFAEMCSHCGTLEKPSEKIEAIYNILQTYMPLPPFDATAIDENPSFQFSHAECLLYALHSLGKQCPEFFLFSNDNGKLKEFRSRLQYLARGTQGYIKSLKDSIRGKLPDELQSEENKIKITALKTTSNINTLIRDLFHSPPIFKSSIQLPWTIKKISVLQELPAKRHVPITFTELGSEKDGPKKSKGNLEQKVYIPPSVPGLMCQKCTQGFKVSFMN